MSRFDLVSIFHGPLPRRHTYACACILLIICVFWSPSQAWATTAADNTTLTVTSAGSDVTSVSAGAVVTLTASVVSGTTPVSPGQVKFCDATAKYCEDSALLATAQLTTSGVATYKFRPGVGNHSYLAVFIGTNGYAKNISTASNLTVTAAATYPTTTTIAASGSTGNYTLTATVVGLGSQTISPTGAISFLDTTNGNAVLGSAALGAAVSGRTFMPGSAPGVGSDPASAAAADFNRDGIPDLATLNYQDNSMTVLLGNEDGTYTTLTSSNVGSQPENMIVGDFNGDGIPDLAVSDFSGVNLLILLGNGDGSFVLKSSPYVGPGPIYMAEGDFNGDGILDLAASANDVGSVNVLLGNGDGTFTQGYSLGLGHGYPSAIVSGDFNGDGILDLAVSSGTIMLGNGDGTFTSVSQTITGFTGATVGDFNGDGISDLAITNNAYGALNGAVTVLLSKGDGTFTTGSTLTVGYKTGPITAADFNDDGILDLATANSGDNTVTILLGKGNGTFPTQSSIHVGSSPDAIAAADLNGDGLPDLATANSGNNTVTVLLNELTETATATLNNVSLSTSETHVVAASYSGDSHFNGSTSDTVALTSSQTPTTLQLSSSASPSNVGSAILLTAVLTPSASVSSTTNGEAITFYNNGVSIGTGTLSSGIATLYFTPELVGSTALTATYAGDANFIGATSNSLTEEVTIVTPATTYVVTTNTDTTSGVAANCTVAGSSNCSLRDAIAAAAAKGAASITFDPHAFATPQTITLGNAGGLTIPSDIMVNIMGPTTGSGATLKTLVTVSGGGPVFSVGSSTIASISGLTITGGSTESTGGGIFNNGILTVSNSTISGNSVPFPSGGGGIENDGVMTLIDSSVTGNTVGLTFNGCPECAVWGGGIDNLGTISITNSTIAGNTVYITLGPNPGITDAGVYGGGINNLGTLTMTNSTVAGNSANGNDSPASGTDADTYVSGAGIYGGMTTGTNNIISGNTSNLSEDDCDNGSCGTNGVNGNIIGSNAQLAPLGNYGGPTQTELPLPGSPAICAGVVADIPSGITTDQRGFPRTTTYGSNPPCVDSGSVQTNYSVSFSTEPPTTVSPGMNFAAAVQLNESGRSFPVSGIAIPLALGNGNPGSLNVSSLMTNAAGLAASSALQVSAPGSSDTLVATLPVTTTTPPAPLTSPIAVSATSSIFSLGPANQTITFQPVPSTAIFGVAPISLKATATSGLPVSFSVISGPATISGATLTITGAGRVVVAANQTGNADYAPAPEVTQTIVVNKATLSLSVMYTPSNPSYGTIVTFTGTPTPVGTTSSEFAFVVDKGTANSITVPATIVANTTVTATYGQLKEGAHTVALNFSGTPNYAAATSSNVPVNVTQAVPTLTWTPATSIIYGTNAVSLLSATANTPGSFSYSAQLIGGSSIPLTSSTILAVGSYTLTASFTPTDTIDYRNVTQTSRLIVADKTLTITANNTTRVYGTANPSFTGTITGAVSGGVFTETFTTTAITTSNAGKYTIVPSVTGANIADYAVTANNGTLTITQAASAITLASSTANANLNASVTFTAKITSSTIGSPTGSIQFLNGSTVLGSSSLNSQGVATYTTNALPAGNSTINAVYAGDQNFTGSMSALMQQVTAPSFSLKPSVTQLSLIAGQTGHITITLTPAGGYTGATSFSCTGAPQNTACTFSPATLTADGSNAPIASTMTIATDDSAASASRLLPPSSADTPMLLASLAGLPAFFSTLILFWNRRRLCPFWARSLGAVLLIVCLASAAALIACGGGPSSSSSKPVTPPGTSNISIMAAGTGNVSQSITISLTVTQ